MAAVTALQAEVKARDEAKVWALVAARAEADRRYHQFNDWLRRIRKMTPAKQLDAIMEFHRQSETRG